MPDGSIGSAGSDLALYISMGIPILLALIELAKRVTSIIPGKTDDEIVSKIDKFFRLCRLRGPWGMSRSTGPDC